MAISTKTTIETLSHLSNGDIVKRGSRCVLKKGAQPILTISEDCFFEQLADPSIFGGEGKFWGLPEEAFEEHPKASSILLKSEYATELTWVVDEYNSEAGMVNIHVVGHPKKYEGMNVGAFCSWVSIDDVANTDDI